VPVSTTPTALPLHESCVPPVESGRSSCVFTSKYVYGSSFLPAWVPRPSSKLLNFNTVQSRVSPRVFAADFCILPPFESGPSVRFDIAIYSEHYECGSAMVRLPPISSCGRSLDGPGFFLAALGSPVYIFKQQFTHLPTVATPASHFVLYFVGQPHIFLSQNVGVLRRLSSVCPFFRSTSVAR